MKWSEGQQFENPPAGSFIARCYSVVDMGTQQHSYQGETWGSRDVRITFELPGELMTGKYKPEFKGKPFSVSMTVKQSLHAKSKLRPMLESWRGKKFTSEEIAAYDPKKLVGVPCRLSLVENGDYVNISSISPLGRGEKCPKQVNESVYLSLAPNEFDMDVFRTLTEKTQQKIEGTPEFMALMNGEGEQQEPTNHEAGTGAEADNDEVPF